MIDKKLKEKIASFFAERLETFKNIDEYDEDDNILNDQDPRDRVQVLSKRYADAYFKFE